MVGLRGGLRHLASGPAEGEQVVVSALAERVSELLEREDFEVSTDGVLVTVRGVGQFRGRSITLMSAVMWRAPLPTAERLTIVFGAAGRSLQALLTQAYRRPWPGPNAEAHALVTDDAISVWWGGEAEADAVERLRPISRAELGV